MSQEKLARLCGFSCRSIQAWEKGRSLPGCEAICVLCDALDCSADWLLGIGPYREELASSRLDSASSSMVKTSCRLSDASSSLSMASDIEQPRPES